MSVGLKNRAVDATALIERSRRSYRTVHVHGTDLETKTILCGSFHLIDLAGNERVARSEVKGDRLQETKCINRSLSTLGDVIFVLARKNAYVPYRNSKLTQLLQGSLAKTIMFVQNNPYVLSYSETVSTLKFAERVSGVELGAAQIQKEGGDVKEQVQPNQQNHLQAASSQLSSMKSSPKVAEIVSQIQRELAEAEEMKRAIDIPLPPSGQNQSTSAWGGVEKMQMQGTKRRAVDINNPINKAYNMEVRSQIDSEIARAFYSGGLPFHFARNPHYIKSYNLAASSNISSYLPPTYNALRTTLLQKERANVERLLVPIKTTWKEKGVTIVSDGWSDSQRRPLINFMVVTETGPMFLKAVNCEGQIKNKFFIADLIKGVVMEVGPQNVVQVIIDNAPVCKAAVHTLNLRALMIAPLKLLSVAETRFASVIIMLKRFKLLKRSLERLVLCEEWSSYRECDTARAQVIRSTMLDELWWDKVDYILQFSAPIYDMLRFADTDKPSLHLIYDMWDDMIEKVKNIIYMHERKELTEKSAFYDVVDAILIDRWTKSSSPLHCSAHSLNPRYYSDAWLTMAPNRLPPHQDIELSEERNKCFKRYFPNSEARTSVNVEFARFSGQMDTFGSADSIEDRATMDPKMWLVHGASAPNIQKIALKLLGQPCSSSCCERNWSTYSFIHSIRRNKILPTRAEDLVYVHTSLRLLSRKSEQYAKGETKLWDVGGDQFDPLDGAEELEIANLSLDEPELEAIIIQDD
ncbi:hypothetical protein OROMI_032611 [Orobanche minor]